MATKVNLKFETIRDMIEYVVSDRYCYSNTYKWHLGMSSVQVYIDLVAGEAWDAAFKPVEEAWNRLPYAERYPGERWNPNYDNVVEPGDPNYMLKTRRIELFKSRPERVNSENYYLFHGSSSRYGYGRTSIDVGHVLGAQLAAANAKNSNRTLRGWIKLLGKSDIGDMVKSAQKQVDDNKARNDRNHARFLVEVSTDDLMAKIEDAAKKGVVLDSKYYTALNELMFAVSGSKE